MWYSAEESDLQLKVSWRISYNKVHVQTVRLQTRKQSKATSGLWAVKMRRWQTARMWQNWEPKLEGWEQREEEAVETDGSWSCGRTLLRVLISVSCFLLNYFNLNLCASWFGCLNRTYGTVVCVTFLLMFPILFLIYCFNVPILFLSVLQINLRLILVSGKTKEFLFSPNDSAADIARHVYDNWPMGE